MSNSNGTVSNMLSIKSHEDRLQKVEQSLQEAVVELAQISTHQDYLISAVQTSSTSILDKLDQVTQKIDSFEDRLVPTEAHVAAARDRTQSIKNITKTAIVGLVSALAAALGAYIWGLLIK